MADEAGGVDRRRRSCRARRDNRRSADSGNRRCSPIRSSGGGGRVVQRQRREADAAIAGDHGRDALARLRRHVRRREQRPVVMRVHVDKTGRDDLAATRRSRARPAILRDLADRRDPVAGDRHVGRESAGRRCRRSPCRRAGSNRPSEPPSYRLLPSRRLREAGVAVLSDFAAEAYPCGSADCRPNCSSSLLHGRNWLKDQREPTCRSSIATAHTGPDAIQSRRPTGIASRYRPHIRSCNRRLSLRRRAVRV